MKKKQYFRFTKNIRIFQLLPCSFITIRIFQLLPCSFITICPPCYFVCILALSLLYVKTLPIFFAMFVCQSTICVPVHNRFRNAEVICNFYILLTVHLDVMLVNNQLDALFSKCIYFYFTPVHVSSSKCSSSGGTVCINTPSVTTYSGSKIV